MSGLKLRAHDLLEQGVIDAIVPEPSGGAQRDYDAAARLVMERRVHHLSQLSTVKPKRLVQNRANRFGSIGSFERSVVKIARSMVDRLRGGSEQPSPAEEKPA